MCCPLWMFFHHLTRRDGCCNGLLVADRNYDTISWPAHRGRSGWYQDSLYMYHVRSRNATSLQVVNLSHQSQPRLSCLSRAHDCQKTHGIQSKASHLVQYNRPWICNLLWPCYSISRHKTRSISDQVMACWLTAPSHYLKQSWLNISKLFASICGQFCKKMGKISLIDMKLHQPRFPDCTSGGEKVLLKWPIYL